MINKYLRLGLYFILLVLVQVLILNQIALFSYAVPLLYVYFIVKLPVNFNKNLSLLIAFLLGFCVDLFTNTYGMNAAACVFVTFLRPSIQKMFFSLQDFDSTIPCTSKLGVFVFYKYAATVVLVHHIAIFLIEYLSLMNIVNLLLHIISSTILTMFIIYIWESFSFGLGRKDERR